MRAHAGSIPREWHIDRSDCGVNGSPNNRRAGETGNSAYIASGVNGTLRVISKRSVYVYIEEARHDEARFVTFGPAPDKPQ